MFMPKTLKDAIDLTLMQEEQMDQQCILNRLRENPPANTQAALSYHFVLNQQALVAPYIAKRLSWDEK